MQNLENVQRAAAALRKALGGAWAPTGREPVGLVLGTGLSGPAEGLPFFGGGRSGAVAVPYAGLPGFPASGVAGHAGLFMAGRLPCDGGERPVIMALGRCHLYEGRSPAEVCMGVRVMAGLGVKTLIITNAAGALNPTFDVGALMCLTDMINHTGVSPLSGPNADAWGPRFPDMSAPLDAGLRALALDCAAELGIRLERGVYIGVHGPEMETPAETRMYRQWGADAIGMSSVLEIIAARHCGMRVLGLSCLTNKNLPDCMAPAPLEAILAVAEKGGAALIRLVQAVLAKL